MYDNDTEAIPGGAVFETFKKLVDLPSVKKEVTQQNKIASLAGYDGFKAYKEVFNYYINELRNIPIDPKKDTVNSVGFRYLASQVAIEYLETLRDLPDRYKKLKESQDEHE